MSVQGTKEQLIEEIEVRQRNFRNTFQMNQPANIEVIEHLKKFCRAEESCVVPGDRDMSLVLEGRREVWLMIDEFLNKTPEQIFAHHAREQK